MVQKGDMYSADISVHFQLPSFASILPALNSLIK